MEREELIKKWLDHNLDTKERIDFEALEDYEELIKLSKSSGNFRAPSFDHESEYNILSQKLKEKQTTHWIKPLLRIAAVILLGFSVFYFANNRDTVTSTTIAEQSFINLPDASSVTINALSKVTYNQNSWKKNREISLDGEAYFKVAKGSKFDVFTKSGKVSVLGTEFNVKQRDHLFEVTCYEGSVEVNYNNTSLKLLPGEHFSIINGVLNNDTVELTQPSWLYNESSFKSKPLFVVLNEFERQYNITIDRSQIDNTVLFTGTFAHNDMDLALQSITLPVGINYVIKDGTVFLTRE